MSYWTRPAPKVQRRRALSTSRIALEATELLDEEGLEGLTLRRLAGRLGVAQSSLYRHVRTAEDVLDLALDHALGADPDLGSVVADKSLEELLNCWYQHLTRHPWASEVVARRPLLGPHYLALSDTLCARVMTSGTRAERTLEITYALSNYVIGCAVAQRANRGNAFEADPAWEETRPWLAAALHAGPPSRSASFRTGLEALLRSVGVGETSGENAKGPFVN